jgi:DNA-nicking Smr family endonuclease
MFFSKEDIEAWKAATRNVRRFLHMNLDFDSDNAEIEKKQIVSRETLSKTSAISAKKGSISEIIKPHRSSPVYVPDIFEGEAGRMDRNAFLRLKSGKTKPHIIEDLHGMNLQDAHEHFYSLIKQAHENDKRCILLITGKGFDTPSKIRSALPCWINDPDLKPLILAYTHAQAKDGGKGAFYIYLSK